MSDTSPIYNPGDVGNTAFNNPAAYNNPYVRLAWKRYQQARQSSYGEAGGQQQDTELETSPLYLGMLPK